MSDRASFLAAIAAAPDDDLPRLVFADYLEENGEAERAEFVRRQVAEFREYQTRPLSQIIRGEQLPRSHPLRVTFETHFRDWFGPVYEAVGLPVPDAGTIGTPAATLLGRLVRGVAGLLPRFVTDVAGVLTSQWEAGGLFPLFALPSGFVLRGVRQAPAVVVSRGFLDHLSLRLADLPPAASLPAAFALEPIPALDLEVPADVGVWRRFDGPHLARVHSSSLTLMSAGLADLRPAATAVVGSPHWTGLRELTLTADVIVPLGSETVLLRCTPFEVFRHSPHRTRLRKLVLNNVPDFWRPFDQPDHGFDRLSELWVSVVNAGGMPDLSARFAAHLRGQLTRLNVAANIGPNLAWLLTGPAWAKLERLDVSGELFDDDGLQTLIESGSFPALRELHLMFTRVDDAGAMALAGSALGRSLRRLGLLSNPIGDAGVTALAGLFDGQLEKLRLTSTGATISPEVRVGLQRYAPQLDLG